MAVIRRCVCCEKEYEYCPNCAKSNQPSWMVTFCCEECKDLFNLVSAYNVKRIGSDAVLDYIKMHHTAGKKYASSVQKVFDEVSSKKSLSHEIEEPVILKKEDAPLDEPRPERDYEHHSRRNKKRRYRQY